LKLPPVNKRKTHIKNAWKVKGEEYI